MSANFIVEAEVRSGKGTAASRRARRDGKVPVVVYGGGEDEQYLLVDHNKIMLQLEVEAFHSALVQLKVDGDLQRAILRDVHMHPFKSQVLHLDFQRVSRKDTITMSVPLHFVGENDCPGVKVNHGIMSHSATSVDISCLGSDLPEYIAVDVSNLDIGDSFLLGDITLPEGVSFASTVSDSDKELPVASVLAPKQASTEEDEADADSVEAEEGAAESEADAEAGDDSES